MIYAGVMADGEHRGKRDRFNKLFALINDITP